MKYCHWGGKKMMLLEEHRTSGFKPSPTSYCLTTVCSFVYSEPTRMISNWLLAFQFFERTPACFCTVLHSQNLGIVTGEWQDPHILLNPDQALLWSVSELGVIQIHVGRHLQSPSYPGVTPRKSPKMCGFQKHPFLSLFSALLFSNHHNDLFVILVSCHWLRGWPIILYGI